MTIIVVVVVHIVCMNFIDEISEMKTEKSFTKSCCKESASVCSKHHVHQGATPPAAALPDTAAILTVPVLPSALTSSPSVSKASLVVSNALFFRGIHFAISCLTIGNSS